MFMLIIRIAYTFRTTLQYNADGSILSLIMVAFLFAFAYLVTILMTLANHGSLSLLFY